MSRNDTTHAEDAVFAAALVSGFACLEAGVWISYGFGRALMLTGALMLVGCWRAS